jgi:hypothetical protein
MYVLITIANAVSRSTEESFTVNSRTLRFDAGMGLKIKSLMDGLFTRTAVQRGRFGDMITMEGGLPINYIAGPRSE